MHNHEIIKEKHEKKILTFLGSKQTCITKTYLHYNLFTMILTFLITSLFTVSVLLIKSLEILPKAKGFFKKLNWKEFFKGNRASLQISDKGVTSLKLEAQKVNEFTGDYDVWPKWKSRTECAFNGSGYEKILTDLTFSEQNPKMNAIVYSQLAVATVDGNAHHLVKQHEDTRDGYAAWQALVEWFDGDIIKNETAEALREKLETLSLHPGVTASDYVNKYMMRYQELEKIPGEGMSSSHARYLFLRNIHDDRYEMTVKYLRNSGADLQECVTAIRKEERDQIRKRMAKRKLQNTLRRFRNEVGDNDEKESNDHTPPKPKRIRRLTGVIDTTKSGCLTIPNEKWSTLTDDDKAFVQKYNAKIKHNESTDSVVIPEGVTIKNKSRRNRTSTSDKTDAPDGDDESSESDTPPPKKQKTITKKKVQFHLTSHESDDADE